MTPRLTPVLSLSVACATLLIAGCQGGHSASPTDPAVPASQALPPTPTAIPASVLDADVHPGQGLLAANSLTLDPTTMTAQLEPLRFASAIGDAFDVDIYEYLKSSPCSDCLQIKGLAYSPSGNVEVSFVARHPFPFGPNRYDLHVFDVRGTLIPIGNSAVATPLMSDMAGVATPVSGRFGVLENADGYSAFFTEQVAPYLGGIGATADGTIFPYKTFFRDLGASNYDGAGGTFTSLEFPSGHNAMAMGEGFESGPVAYDINVGGLNSQVSFLFLLDAAYGASATRPTRLTPKYYLPQFHRKEAFEVQMAISGATLVAGQSTDLAQATVTAFDWQGELAADPAFGPTSAADGVLAKSAPTVMEFSVPGVTTGIQTKTNGVDFTGVMNPGEYWTTYETTFSFTNSALAAQGTYYAVAAIRDDLYGTGLANPVFAYTRTAEVHPLTDITTYAVAPVEVLGTPPPTFTLDRNPAPADPVPHGAMVQFLIDNIATPGSTLLSVEADPDYSGIPASFNPAVACVMIDPDTYQTQYDWRDLGFLPTAASPMNFAVRVTNAGGTSTILTSSVQLAPNQPPTVAWTGTAPTTGGVGNPVTFLPAHVNASDPDGTVTGYRINWGDGSPEYTGTLPASHTYTTVSMPTVTLAAQDNGYGPGTSPAPQPDSAESVAITRQLDITAGGIVAPWVEDFETTADGGLPADWVQYRPASVGTTWQFGVRSGTTSPSPTAGQAKVLEESGWGQTSAGDRNYATSNPGTISGAPQAARWGVFTPEIQIPNDASTWVLEITHWTSYNYVTLSPPCGGSFGGDGANIATKSGAVGTLTATETGLIRHLNGEYNQNPPWFNPNAGADGNFFLGLPGGWASTSPMFGRGPNSACPNAGGTYVISRLVIPTSYKGQAMRLYLWHGQQQNFSGWNGVGGSFWSDSATGYNGWRIDKVEIKTM